MTRKERKVLDEVKVRLDKAYGLLYDARGATVAEDEHLDARIKVLVATFDVNEILWDDDRRHG